MAITKEELEQYISLRNKIGEQAIKAFNSKYSSSFKGGHGSANSLVDVDMKDGTFTVEHGCCGSVEYSDEPIELLFMTDEELLNRNKK